MANDYMTYPIDPDRLLGMRDVWATSLQPEEHDVVPTRHVSLESKCFVILREIAKMFVDGTKWDKKARIVLEYDPHAERLVIKTFMEYGEADAPEARKSSWD